MSNDLSLYEEYHDKWVRADDLLKTTSAKKANEFGDGPKFSTYLKSRMKKNKKLNIFLTVLTCIASLCICILFIKNDLAGPTFPFIWSTLSFFSGGFLNYPIILGISALITMLCFRLYQKKYEKMTNACTLLTQQCNEYLEKAKEYAENEIKKYESKPQIQEITKFLFYRLHEIIRRADRPEKRQNIYEVFHFEVYSSLVSYSQRCFNCHGEPITSTSTFLFHDHRIDDLKETQMFIASHALMRNLEKELRKQMPKDPSGTDYKIKYYFNRQPNYYYRQPDAPGFHRLVLHCSIGYEAKNAYYKDSVSW